MPPSHGPFFRITAALMPLDYLEYWIEQWMLRILKLLFASFFRQSWSIKKAIESTMANDLRPFILLNRYKREAMNGVQS
jgi:hypothetical protein